MTEMRRRATSPRAAAAGHTIKLEWLVVDIDDRNTAVTRQQSIDPLSTFFARDVLRLLLSLVAQTPTPDPLKDALTEGGVDLAPIDAQAVDPLSRTAVKYQVLLDNSLDTEEAARVLGTDVGRVEQRLANRTLYGIPTKEGWKIPAFQFEDGELLPGLESVMSLLHDDLHPIAVQNWFTSPSTDLLIRDERVSPRQWLLSGRNPDNVARIAIDV
jgi:hypothetical protein